MKRFTKNLKMICVYLGCITLLSTTANAATFTAVGSGNFSSGTTWGGTAPSGSITGDIIIIPSGITVTLDQDAHLNGLLSVLTVNGTLTATSGSDLILTMGTLAGNGSITVDSMALALASGIAFTGSIVADRFTSLGSTISSSANITVSNTLGLAAGTLSMASGNLTLSSGGTIVVSGGVITTNGGTVDLTNAYHVRYINSSATAGLELTGAGLSDVEINVPASSAVKLSADLNSKGTLTLSSGILDLNGKSLTISGNGNLAASGTGTINSTSASSITINTNNSLNGTLRFNTGANTVNNFTVNLANNSHMINIGSALTVNGQLALQSGKVNVGSNLITVASTGSLSGGSANSYIITGNDGKLMLNLAAGNSATFHVGTVAKYAPAVITANTGAATGNVSVSVNESVYTNGTSGNTISSTDPVVNATWHVTSTATANINLNMDVMWSTDMEVNGFNRSKAYLSHYTNGSWDVTATAAATATGNGMYKMSRSNITSLSPFAVMGEKTTGVNTATPGNSLTIYPNPVTNAFSFTNVNLDRLVIFDVSGRVVKSVDLSTGINNVSVEDLNTGTYYAHFYHGQDKNVQKFMKN